MEFFRIINVNTTEEILRKKLSLEKLELMSNQLFPLGDPGERKMSIGSLWGEFTLTRDLIRGGLRFALEECPNALAWTLTTGFDPAPDAIVVHLTINRQQKEKAFIDEVEDFLDDHANCLVGLLTNS